MMDLVIRGGTIVDGSGEPRFRGDVAVDGGRIAAVGRVSEKGREEVDADGLVVAPGFVDVHTHYDAQYTWDPYATSSIWHGVTTTVIGNCGWPANDWARSVHGSSSACTTKCARCAPTIACRYWRSRFRHSNCGRRHSSSTWSNWPAG